MGFPVPPTWALTYRAYEAYGTDREGTLAHLRDELTRLPSSKTWAVRSSADVEDQVGKSFAGQFSTFLGVRGVDDLVTAVEAIWASARSSQVSDYAQRGSGGDITVRMGVIIQEMVEPVYSGVSFSRDPVTGRNEVTIEAIEGSGDGLVQRGFEPLDQRTGGVPEDMLALLKRGTSAIARRMGRDVDIEWAYDGHRLWWLQVRPITANDKVTIYSNRMAKEMLPGIIMPLVWSVNIPLNNGAWIRIFQGITGRKDLDPFTLSKMFHYRVYFNMGEIGKIWESLGLPSDSLERLTLEGMGNGMDMRIDPRTAACVPRIALFAIKMLGWPGKVDRFINTYEAKCRDLAAHDLGLMSDQELLGRYQELFLINREGAYYNIITVLLTAMFTSVLKRMLEDRGESLEGVEWNSLQCKLMDCYPNSSMGRLNSLYRSLPEDVRTTIDQKGPMVVKGMRGAERFIREWEMFLERFGHLSESGNDMTRPPWRERPMELMKAVRDTPEVPARAARKSISEVGSRPFTSLFLTGIASRASRYSVLKERMGSAYSLGYGLFRPLFLELGARLEKRGHLGSREDVFYLYLEELKGNLDGDGKDLLSIVVSRKEEIIRVGNMPLPEVIFGEQLPPLIDPRAIVHRGLATSKGYYRGRTRIVRNVSELDRVRTGDVMVIPYSDVSWSSAFSRAGAVISESGGILSHSSILAREYGIPSVVSVPHAMTLPDDAEVVVDGFKGLVYLDPGRPGPSSPFP